MAQPGSHTVEPVRGSAVPLRATTTSAPTAAPTAASAPGVDTTTQGPCIDDTMRRLLRIKPTTPNDEAGAHRIFEVSIFVSAARCLLTYVILPIITPAAGAASGAGPAIGIPIGIVALIFDVLGIRRFWAANHRYRKQITVIYAVVIVFVSVMLSFDIAHVLT